jgi:hypothetical protein
MQDLLLLFLFSHNGVVFGVPRVLLRDAEHRLSFIGESFVLFFVLILQSRQRAAISRALDACENSLQ